MSSYYYPTSTFSGASRPNPTSNKPGRAPIYNPYDKFSQNEFDSWIGGITGALKRALGQDGEEEPSTVKQNDAGLSNAVVKQTFSEDSPYPDSEVEDSFAEIKTRRDKGKGRDPREGPGLGGEHQPIEILSSDSDGEEDGEEEERAFYAEDAPVEGEGSYSEDDRNSAEVEEDAYGSWEEESEGSGGFAPEASGHRLRRDDAEDAIAISSGEEDEGSPEFTAEPVADDERYFHEEDHDSAGRVSPDVETRHPLARQRQHLHVSSGQELGEEEKYDGSDDDGLDDDGLDDDRLDRDGLDSQEYYDDKEGHYENEGEGWDEESLEEDVIDEDFEDGDQDGNSIHGSSTNKTGTVLYHLIVCLPTDTS